MTGRLAAAGVLLFTTVLFATEPAFAQVAFVQGGITMDVRRFSGQPDTRVFDANVATATIGGGGFLTSLISAGVELDMSRESAVGEAAAVTIGGRPETITTTYSSNRRSVSALFGIHSTAQRAVRVGAYAGLAFTAFSQRIATTAPPIILPSPPPAAEFTHLGANPIVGVDVAIAISRHFALVGFARGQALGFGSELHGFSVRPGVAARVSF